MNLPDLNFNNFYPFYTQKKTGRKTGYSYKVITMVHLSEVKTISFEEYYIEKELCEIKINFNRWDNKKKFEPQKQGKQICYVDLAKSIRPILNKVQKSISILGKEKAYEKSFLGATILKYNSSMELELDWWNLALRFKEVDYIIENGKMKKLKPDRKFDEDSETGSLLNHTTLFLNEVENRTKYLDVTQKDFSKRVNSLFNSINPYLESPKFLRKSEYSLK